MNEPLRPSAGIPRERKLKDQAAGFASHAGAMRRECEEAKNRISTKDKAETADHLREAGRDCARAADLLEGN
jgi:hypothetical protein